MDPVRWQKVRELFDATVELEPTERSRLLAEIEDLDLRREVDSLLAAHDAPGPIDRFAAGMGVLRSEALARRATEPTATEPAGGLAPGRRLGRHEIRVRLGAGGMGEVYRAYDTRLQREVAIKVLSRHVLGRPGALQRFEQEARAASALNHPNIVTLYDIGEEPSFPYIVMELVEGDSLRQMLHGPWPLELLLDLAIQIADALVAAHDRDIVHRDLKPENILVTRDGVAKIVDFGLAEFRPALEAGVGERPVPAGAVQGTLGYLPPEILSGKPADPRSDQFSFAAIVYEMATGTPAFPGATALETLTRSVASEPRPLAELRPDLPAALVGTVDRSLRKDPGDRYPSTRDLLDELRAIRRSPRAAIERKPKPQHLHFAKAQDGTQLAYAFLGDGPPLVKAANWLSHLEMDWQGPIWTHWLELLSRGRCLIRYDARGNGLSDWNPPSITFEDFVADLGAIFDAAGVRRAPVVGISQAAAVAAAYAARHPERVSALILIGGCARGWRVKRNPALDERFQTLIALMRQGWGGRNAAFRQIFTTSFFPDASREHMEWFNELQRRTASPVNAAALLSALGDIDVRDDLARIQAPTLVFHSRGDAVVPMKDGLELAGGIPGARFVPLDSANHVWLADDPAWTRFSRELEQFLRDSAA